jgi:hypothetical protein
MFTYRNIKTNEVIESKTPIKDKNLILVSWIKNMMVKTNKIIKK